MAQNTYSIDNTICTHCCGCSSVCPVMAIIIDDFTATISSKCIKCGICLRFCAVGAIKKPEESFE